MRLTSSFTLLLAGAVFAVPVAAFADVSTAHTSTPTLLRLDKGDKPKADKDRTDVEKQADVMLVIADIADRVVSPEGVSSVTDLVAAKDRERLDSGMKKSDAKKAAAALADPAKEFGEIWRDQYKEGFDAKKNVKQLQGMRVEFRDGGADNNRDYAFVYFNTFGTWKPFEIHLTRSAGATWRVQLPNDVDAEKLATELTKDVKKLNADRPSWYRDTFMGYNSAVTQLVHAMSFATDKKAGESDH